MLRVHKPHDIAGSSGALANGNAWKNLAETSGDHLPDQSQFHEGLIKQS